MGVAKASVDTRMTASLSQKVIYPCSFDNAGGSLASLPQLSSLMVGWQRVRTLGQANFGKVYLARATEPKPCLELPEVFALKRMPREKVLAGGCGLESAQNEILAGLALKGLDLPYTAQVFFAAQDDDYFYLATEYCEKGELFNIIQALVSKKRSMGEGVLREIMSQLLQALEGMHAAGIAHRDATLENVLITETGSVRLIDLGQAIMVSPPGEGWKEAAVSPCERGLPGKACYRAPELYLGVPYYATKVDSYSCGVLLYTLAVGSYPPDDLFAQELLGTNSCRPLQAHIHAAGLESRLSPGLQDLLEQLLAPRPAQCATIAEAAAHPWLVGMLDGLDASTQAHAGGSEMQN